jgi:hypothetical protein
VYGGQPGHRWTPLTTPAGQPLSVADQRRRSSPQQPLAGGLRLAGSHPVPGEWRITLSDQAGQVVRGWRVSSRTRLGAEGATPALVGGDPVVVFEVTKETSREFLYEYEFLRLARAGGTSQRFAVAPAARVNWGDVPITGVRVGPDGQLYQLRTSRTGGVDIARYSLTPDKETPPTTTPALEPTTPKSPPVDNGGITAPTVPPPPAQPAAQPVEPAASDAAARWWLPGLAGASAGTLAGLGMWLLYRRRRPAAG